MRVAVCGPNLNDQSRGQFHVHAAGCRDLRKHARREPAYLSAHLMDAESRLDVAKFIYDDHEIDPADAMSDFYFFSCCDVLPLGR